MIRLFTDFAMGTVGHTKGGPAKVSVISSGLMGTINGPGVANVVTHYPPPPSLAAPRPGALPTGHLPHPPLNPPPPAPPPSPATPPPPHLPCRR
ncbi:MAG: TRAP transporter large permease subunit [Rhodocyclaceae bacterium]|nr:TRAP transporter large permease subunit [Rhodocyclaceae bacterium]